MQAEAIGAGIDGRDSLVVMPTGGGKSLCYQIPPLVTGRLSIVVSPLIALMKDQVDALKLAGYPAAAMHSNVDPEELQQIRGEVEAKEISLLLVAPERLFSYGFINWLKSVGVGSFAIDEAHCISQWGHDFRPEYRRLAEVRDRFPEIAFHAYTATATPKVQADIVEQLRLHDPVKLVGRFDRPNLTYRILPRVKLIEQATEALMRHEDRAAIVYCLSRKDTETLSEALRARGVDARAYHAGLSAKERSRVSERFKTERLNVVVATVAFGMGIDRGDVRCVVHAAMPRTVEGYQQETGRAGRDGLPAECVMLYSSADVSRWTRIMESSAAESGADPEYLAQQKRMLEEMRRMAAGGLCRHRALTEYFGQQYESPPGLEAAQGCAGCDVCLQELEPVPDASVVAQKILSAVARVHQSYGAAHVIDILRGRATSRITDRGHHSLSVFGLLKNMRKATLQSCIDQLVDAQALAREEGEYPTLRFTPSSIEVLRGSRTVSLVRPKGGEDLRDSRRAGSMVEGKASALADSDRQLFESLRLLRRAIADEMKVPPYIVCGDATLEEIARQRPTTDFQLMQVKGIGRRKLEQFGERLLAQVREFDTASRARPHGVS